MVEACDRNITNSVWRQTLSGGTFSKYEALGKTPNRAGTRFALTSTHAADHIRAEDMKIGS